MSFNIYIIIAAVILIFYFFVKLEGKIAEKNMNENHFIVRQSILYLLAGVICTLFFSAITVWAILFPNDTAEWWVFLIFSLSIILGLYLLIYSIKWKIKIDDEHIVYTPFFGKKIDLTFKEITKVKIQRNNKMEVYTSEKKVFSIEYNTKGYNILLSRFKTEQIPIDFNSAIRLFK